MQKKIQLIVSNNIALSIVLVVLIALISGYFLGERANQEKYKKFSRSFQILRNPAEKTALINPLVGSASNPATDVGFYIDEKEEVLAFLEQEKQSRTLDEYSFYVRDLNSGFWFGENESNSFFPASLFKLPIAIAVYAQAEDDPSFLTKKLVYTQDFFKEYRDNPEAAKTSLSIGSAYTIEQLVETMLVQSDNLAKDILLSSLDIKYLQAIFNIAHLTDPTKLLMYTVSTREYSLFLRILYGASFLNEGHSELLLKLLTKTQFTQGLVAGVPSSISVAHKYGVFQETGIQDGKEVTFQFLHDCGIIYHPTRPYVVCIMTKGKDEKSLAEIVRHVSSILYTHKEKEDY